LFRKYFRKREKIKPHTLIRRQSAESAGDPIPLSTDVKANTDMVKQLLGSPHDLIVREFTVDNTPLTCAVVCIDGLVDSELIHDKIVKHIQLFITTAGKEVPASVDAIISFLLNEVVSIIEVNKGNTLDDALMAILSGDTALFINGTEQIIIVDTKGWSSRGIDEPVSEGLVRGPREGFNESVREATVRIRRRIRDPHLRLDGSRVGRRSKTDMVIAYMDGIVNPDLVQEVKRRISTLDIDDVEESGYIEQWIEDNFVSPFPQVQNTERPDKVASALLQGRVAILLDNTPMVLMVPVTLGQLLHSPEDYYERWLAASLTRMLRYIAAFLAVFSPALYIALVTYHPGLIPSDLAFSIAATREGVPFPAFVEAFMMVTTMELLQEAGIRLPRPIGQTVGIVGGLVIGEAAVSAGIVSPVMVIVVALTAIASFAIPAYNVALAFRMIRYAVMIASAIFGLYGVVLTYIAINIHLTNLTSFGVPYTSPFAPGLIRDWKDIVLRAPITFLKTRPQMNRTQEESRMDTGDSS